MEIIQLCFHHHRHQFISQVRQITASAMSSGGRTTRQLNALTVALEKTQVKSN